MKYIKLFESKKVLVRGELLDKITFDKKTFDVFLYKNFYKDNSYENLYNVNFIYGDWTPLTTAVYYNRNIILKKLIKFGANVDFPDSNNKTPLIIAAEENKLEAIQILIEANADWNIKDNLNHDFMYYISDKYKKIIIEDYPEKYKDYLFVLDTENFNL